MSTRPCAQDLQQMVTLSLTYPHLEDECSIYHDQVHRVTGLPCHALSSILLPLPFFHLKTESPFSFLVLVNFDTAKTDRLCLLFNVALLPPLAHLKNVTLDSVDNFHIISFTALGHKLMLYVKNTHR